MKHIRYDQLSPQAYAVLDELKYQYSYCYLPRLAANLGIPEASVRRSIGQLRKARFWITVEKGMVRLYR